MKDELRKGAHLVVRAASLSQAGDGLVQLGDAELLVPRMWPGEEAEVRIDHVGRRRAHGTISELREAHPGRRKPPCPHHGRCTGCPLMDASEAMQHAAKRQLLASYGLEVETIVSRPESLGYRWSAKRVAFGAPGRLSLGSFRRGSHEPADMSGCLVEHPDIVACAEEVVEVANRLRVAPFDETRRRGALRAVWLRTDGAGATLVTLVSGGEDVAALASALERPTSVAMASQLAAGNDLRGGQARFVRGGPLQVELCGAQVTVGPLGFLQPNPRVASLAYQALVGEGRGALAFDLYAGSGITTQLLRRRYDQVLACESFPESARALGVEPRTAEAFLEEAPGEPDVVTANPPRAGLGEAVCRLLAARAPRELRIMSCHPRSLVRDLAVLERAGMVRAQVAAFDTLPQTMHVELVCVLQRGERV